MLIVVPEYKLWFKFQPLGALSIAAVMVKNGLDVDFLDGAVVKGDFFSKARSLASKHSRIGISANVSQAHSGLKLAEMIRSEFPDRTIIWGGPFPTIEYEKLIPEYADVVVLGEGEIQAASLAKAVPIEDIPGVAYWSSDKREIVVNPRPPFIDDLDSLPFPALHLIAGFRYRVPGKQPVFSIITERGCPYHCVNCTKIIHGNRFRTRSVENVLNELERLSDEFKAGEIHIWDDNFTLLPERAKDICRGIVERGLNEKLRFALPNGIRADINDDELFNLMRKANFYFAIVAVESADQNVIDSLEKDLDLRKVEATVNSLVEKGFRVGLFFMMGLPFDTIETLRKNAVFAASLPAHHAYFFRVTPFPGTKLYEMSQTAENTTSEAYLTDFINYDRPSGRSANANIPPRVLTFHIWRAHLMFYATRWRVFRILGKFIVEGNMASNLRFLFKCGIRLLFTCHR
ncbi:MAG: B12-binding domain-containing radical SAM protein [Kiritimatiellaeota bacterium]|nr:B12-binding domain-containing radical SAM protein [Kiritimatiellota bacterium]